MEEHEPIFAPKKAKEVYMKKAQYEALMHGHTFKQPVVNTSTKPRVIGSKHKVSSGFSRAQEIIREIKIKRIKVAMLQATKQNS